MTQRMDLSLDGLWRFSPDPGKNGEELGFWKVDYEARSWPELPVPSCFDAAGPNLDCYEGICWYRRSFRLGDDWSGRRTVLRFAAVNYRARVWLNGELLGENRDGCLPFEFELGDRLCLDGDNLIAVEVDNAHHTGDVPGMHTGWRRFGGILREVTLVATAECHIAQARMIATPAGDRGTMALRVTIGNGSVAQAQASVQVDIHDPDGAICATMTSPISTMEAGAVETLELAGHVDHVRPWSPDSPCLYRASIRLTTDEQAGDAQEVVFGFRSIEATATGLLLNGLPVFLKGFNRHEDSPRTDMAADHELTRTDLVEMKEAGANFVRLCHYPHHPKTLDMCDELGLLVFAEVPLYFWIDSDEARATNAARVKSAARQLERMVTRDANHPSIIFWSVSNETPEREEEVWRANQELIRSARALDPTRLWVHVSDHWRNYAHFDEDDVVCINYYPSIALAAHSAIPAADLSEVTETWRRNLATLRERYPDKPILITEFGYLSFAGTHGHAYGEDVHARVLEAEYAAFDAPWICGAANWCWADHAWRCGSFLGGLSISPYGVLTRDRQKLQPYWTARRLFTGKRPEPGDGRDAFCHPDDAPDQPS